LVYAHYNKGKKVIVIYNYDTIASPSISKWADKIIYNKDFFPPKQLLIDIKEVILPSIDIFEGKEIVNFDSSKNYVKIIIEAINQKIPVISTFKDDVYDGSKMIKEVIELKNGLKSVGVELMSQKEFEIRLGIMGYSDKEIHIETEVEGKVECEAKSAVENEVKTESKNETEIDVAKYIDHTYLKPEATDKEIDKICNEAKEYHFKAVCINSYWTKRASENLNGSDVLIATVVGFPLGTMPKEVKAYETKRAIEDGTDEIDMVINIGELKAGNYQVVEDDIKAVVEAAQGKTVKVIIETCLLTDEEKVKACLLSRNAKAHFVKTSTGFSKGGATLDDVYLMKQTVGSDMEVKAAGGIRDYETVIKMIEKGATRIGASAGIKIVKGLNGGSSETY
jgi:deoxyribose-phosphate aldolase